MYKVSEAGLEPARDFTSRDFLTTLYHYSRGNPRCSLDYFLTIAYALG